LIRRAVDGRVDGEYYLVLIIELVVKGCIRFCQISVGYLLGQLTNGKQINIIARPPVVSNITTLRATLWGIVGHLSGLHGVSCTRPAAPLLFGQPTIFLQIMVG
jgi:hypothetical protein